MTNGIPLRGEWSDPRISGAQEKAMIRVVKADPGARLLGLDYAMRPVVAAVVGYPPALRVFALQRNGEPTDPKQSDFSHGRFLKEPWGERKTDKEVVDNG